MEYPVLPNKSIPRDRVDLGILRKVLLGEDLAAQIKYWQRAWDTDCLADRNQGKIPAANGTNHAKSSSNPQQISDVQQVLWCGCVRDTKVCSRDEGEKEDEAGEDKDKAYVDSKAANQEDEANHGHDHVVPGLRRVVHGARSTICSKRAGRLMNRVLNVG